MCLEPGGSVIKNPPALQEMQETLVQSLGGEDPLEEETAAHSSILVWKFPWAEEPDGIQSMGPQRVRHDRALTCPKRSSLEVGEKGGLESQALETVAVKGAQKNDPVLMALLDLLPRLGLSSFTRIPELSLTLFAASRSPFQPLPNSLNR